MKHEVKFLSFIFKTPQSLVTWTEILTSKMKQFLHDKLSERQHAFHDPYSVVIKSPLIITLQNIYVKLAYLQKSFLF
jgi:hypothetical protein